MEQKKHTVCIVTSPCVLELKPCDKQRICRTNSALPRKARHIQSLWWTVMQPSVILKEAQQEFAYLCTIPCPEQGGCATLKFYALKVDSFRPVRSSQTPRQIFWWYRTALVMRKSLHYSENRGWAHLKLILDLMHGQASCLRKTITVYSV